jgi:hypothetical protein
MVGEAIARRATSLPRLLETVQTPEQVVNECGRGTRESRIGWQPMPRHSAPRAALGSLDDDPVRLRAAAYVEGPVERGEAIDRRSAELKAIRPAWIAV